MTAYYVVLHGRNGSHCNLRGEVPHLVLAQSESSLTLLKDNFQRPAPGVNPVSFEEVEFPVCCNESVPLVNYHFDVNLIVSKLRTKQF